MTGNVTNLEVSRRLAEAWPREDHERGWAWCGGGDFRLVSACYGMHLRDGCEIVPARTLPELEAEIQRMEAKAHVSNEIVVTRWVAFLMPPCRPQTTGQADTIIDALATALAEAKEKP